MKNSLPSLRLCERPNYYSLMLVPLAVLLIFSSSIAAAKTPAGFHIDVVVHPEIKNRDITKVAVYSLDSTEQNVGISLGGMINTALTQTGKYRHAERSQIDKLTKTIAGELPYGEKTVEILGIDASIKGSVAEFGKIISKGKELPSVAFEIKMISLVNTEELWAISSAAVGAEGQSPAILAKELVNASIDKLVDEWVGVDDLSAVRLSQAKAFAESSGKRKITLQIEPLPADRYSSYGIFRSEQENGSYEFVKSVKNKNTKRLITYSDRKLVSGRKYFYKVRAVSFSGLNAPASIPVYATAG